MRDIRSVPSRDVRGMWVKRWEKDTALQSTTLPHEIDTNLSSLLTLFFFSPSGHLIDEPLSNRPQKLNECFLSAYYAFSWTSVANLVYFYLMTYSLRLNNGKVIIQKFW